MGLLAGIGAPAIYFVIFFGKIAEVAVSTMRIVLINRGERLTGSLLGIIEISMWVTITSTVLSGLSEDFLQVVVYVVAFAIGIYLGSWLEEKLAFGLCSIQIVVQSSQEAHLVADTLRAAGFGVTLLQGKGIDDQEKDMLMLMLKRKDVQDAVNIVNKTVAKCLITVSNLASVKGGYMRNGGMRGNRRGPAK